MQLVAVLRIPKLCELACMEVRVCYIIHTAQHVSETFISTTHIHP